MKIIGVGNEMRGDDAIGVLVARQLLGQLPETEVEIHSGDGAALMDSWQQDEHVIVIDCACSGSPPGTIHHIHADKEALPFALFAASTHTFSVAEAIELGRVLGELPPRLEVFAIEGSAFHPGSGVSTEVREAGERLASLIFAQAVPAK